MITPTAPPPEFVSHLVILQVRSQTQASYAERQWRRKKDLWHRHLFCDVWRRRRYNTVWREREADEQTEKNRRRNDDGAEKWRQFQKAVTRRHVVVDVDGSRDDDDDERDAVTEQVKS